MKASSAAWLIVTLAASPLWADDEPKKPAALKPAAVLQGHPDWVAAVAFSPDGKTLAVGSYESITLWDVAERKQVNVLKTATGFVRSVAWSGDGRWLASGSYQTVLLWDVASQKQHGELAGHAGYVTGLVFSPDSRSLASSSEDETAKVWDVDSAKDRLTLMGHLYPVMALDWSHDGTFIATAAGDVTRTTRPGEVKLWDAVTGELRATLPPPEKAATALAISPDGKLVASGGLNEKVFVWDRSQSKEGVLFDGHQRPINSLAFSPNGGWVVSGAGGRFAKGNELRIWNPLTGDTLAIGPFDQRVTAVDVSPDGSLVAAGSFNQTVSLFATAAFNAPAEAPAAAAEKKTLRVGIIGLDTSHVTAFTKILNDPAATEDVANCKVVAAYPKGSPDIESSVSRVPGYTEEVKKLGVEIVDSIEALCEKVDVVLLETNDGRPHLEQVIPVLKAGKPVFIDKPIAGSLSDAIAIFDLAEKHKVPVFSSSSLRFSEGAQALRKGKIGDIVGCDAYSPCSLDKTHPDLFWYGIHGVETLFTVMGTGCESVSRTSTPGLDLAVGTWKGGRIGTFRGIRTGSSGYGGTAFGTKGIEPVGSYGGYRPLLVEIVKFFRTGEVPVTKEETLEIYSFMEAADESKRQGGVPVTLESVLKKAQEEAKKKLAE